MPGSLVYANISRVQLRSAMLYVRDLERMKRFYGDLLEVEPTNQNWTSIWSTFDAGGLRFALHAIPAEIAQDFEIADHAAPRENAPVKLIFEVKNVEGERERLESFGVRTIRRSWQKPGDACDAVDPEGNVFQLCSSGADAPV